MPALLEVRNLTVLYAGSQPALAVNDLSLDVEEGEVAGLLGESGCGKTTLLLAILGLLPASAHVETGSIRFRGRELRTLSDDELRRLRGAEVSVIAQEPSLALNPVRRVGVQVAEVVRAHGRGSGRRGREETLTMLAEVGFEQPLRVHDAYPHELSGGQLQRVVIAQALVCRPALLLADEPTAALDSTTQAELRGLLRTLQSRYGLTVLLVSHDLGSLSQLAQRVYVMYAGRLVERGRSAEVFCDPLHPYTRGLLGALPGPPRAADSAPKAPLPIPGAPPDPDRLPSGCAFEPRCPDRLPPCAERPPRETPLGDNRGVRCFKYGG